MNKRIMALALSLLLLLPALALAEADVQAVRFADFIMNIDINTPIEADAALFQEGYAPTDGETLFTVYPLYADEAEANSTLTVYWREAALDLTGMEEQASRAVFALQMIDQLAAQYREALGYEVQGASLNSTSLNEIDGVDALTIGFTLSVVPAGEEEVRDMYVTWRCVGDMAFGTYVFQAATQSRQAMEEGILPIMDSVIWVNQETNP